MRRFLFFNLLQLSSHYEHSLEALEPSVLEAIHKSEPVVKNDCLLELHRMNKVTMDNCLSILTKFKGLLIQSDEEIDNRSNE